MLMLLLISVFLKILQYQVQSLRDINFIVFGDKLVIHEMHVLFNQRILFLSEVLRDCPNELAILVW